ncbi:ATP-binding cassette domain-containing protein, partial [Nocardiopsis algeriensis]|uniref:ABC transporter ATP-binding protein n=1 Tax=Nocardiopsis algeriensis TaxID=1478215 RepID=UPI003B431C4B
QVLDLLDELRRDLGMALILVSHDLAVVAGSVDEVVVMRHGEAVERGDVRTVLSAPEHPYTQALLAAVPRVEVSRAQRRAQDRADRVAKAGAEGGGAVPAAFAPSADGGRGEPLLSVRDVAQRFKVRGGAWGRSTDFWAVKGVSFDLYRGETLGVVGESGSGKSTLSRTVMR